MKVTRSLLVAVALASCAPMPGSVTTVVPLTTKYDPAETAWYRQGGTASITGSALLRTRGGDAKTCAGLPVSLVPRSTYADERMSRLFGSTDHGFEPVYSPERLAGTDPDYEAGIQRSICDAQGSFAFEHLAAGTYYVTAKVVWEAPTTYGLSPQGGVVMLKVVLASGETRRVVLTE